MNDVVITRLIGGLGNQMFQYAAGRKLSEELNVPLLLDITYLQKVSTENNYTKRDFELDVFNIRADIAKTETINELRKRIDNPILRKLVQSGIIKNNVKYLRDDQPFPQLPKGLNEPIYLEGYWQDETYFREIRNILIEDFTPAVKPEGYNLQLLIEIESCNSASVHVRRGDYVTNAGAAGFHGLCSPEYYESAIARLYEDQKIEKFFVFSDDSNWTKTNLKFPTKAAFIDHNTGKNSYIDLYLMSKCKHHIVANSSFSWWGAWLNENSNKCVIAPARWFASGGGEKIVPSDWIKL